MSDQKHHNTQENRKPTLLGTDSHIRHEDIALHNPTETHSQVALRTAQMTMWTSVVPESRTGVAANVVVTALATLRRIASAHHNSLARIGVS